MTVKNTNLKIFLIIIVFLTLTLTVAICFSSPRMHKPLQLNILEYFIKINADGSTTTIKQITTTSLKGN